MAPMTVGCLARVRASALAVLLVTGACGGSDDNLDEAAATAVAARIDAAQERVTSSQTTAYMTVRLDIPGEPEIAIDDLPVSTVTGVGDLTRTETDGAAIAAFRREFARDWTDPELASLPDMETIRDGEERVYLKLAPLLVFGSTSWQPWLRETARQHGTGFGHLWGLEDLTGGSPRDAVADLGMTPRIDSASGYLEWLTAGFLDGSLLEIRREERTLIAGVETHGYSFVFDARTHVGLPAVVQDSLANYLGGGEPPAGGVLSGMTEPVPFAYTVYIDEADFIRRFAITMDMSEVVTAALEDLVRLGELRDDKLQYLSLLEAYFSVRFDTIALNDPSLVVELPDPSVVVELPDPS